MLEHTVTTTWHLLVEGHAVSRDQIVFGTDSLSVMCCKHLLPSKYLSKPSFKSTFLGSLLVKHEAHQDLCSSLLSILIQRKKSLQQ